MTWARASSVRAAVVAVLLVVAGFPFASRALNGWRNIPTASSNIYQQQYQMGLFLDRFYRGRSVALNDIGAASYLTDFHLLDIYGLANLDIVRMRRARRYASAEIGASATRQAAEVAINLSELAWRIWRVPSGWTRVGQWGVRDNVVLGENALAFYAVHDDERSRLAANLRQFASALPAPVLQSVRTFHDRRSRARLDPHLSSDRPEAERSGSERHRAHRDAAAVFAMDIAAHVHLVLELERVFDVRFDAEEIAELASVAAILNALARRGLVTP